MRLKKTKVVIIVILLIGVVAYLWTTADVRQFAGKYTAVDATDSAYELTLSKFGRVHVADVGAGNPALDGFIYRIPFRDEYYLKAGGETDDVFLDLGKHNGKAKVWLSAIGQTYVDPAVCRIIIIETETAHMQFNKGRD